MLEDNKTYDACNQIVHRNDNCSNFSSNILFFFFSNIFFLKFLFFKERILIFKRNNRNVGFLLAVKMEMNEVRNAFVQGEEFDDKNENRYDLSCSAMFHCLGCICAR